MAEVKEIKEKMRVIYRNTHSESSAFPLAVVTQKVKMNEVSHDFPELYSHYNDQKNTHHVINRVSWLKINSGHVTQLLP